jgi:5-methylthioadenosine/S-adenosylhomocysteine deaminase
MATLNGARALGLEREIGSLEPGKKADLILLDLGSVHMTPRLHGRYDNLLSNIVYSAHSSDVRTVIIDGALVMEDRKVLTVDEAQLRAQVDEASQRVLDRFSKTAG